MEFGTRRKIGEHLISEQQQSLADKIQVFLTDQASSRAGSGNIIKLSDEIMISVGDFYKNPTKADGFRTNYGMKKKHKAGWDSGGFQFLMGKLKVDDSAILPCGIEVPATAQETINLYKRIGIHKTDYPIQLDLPPRYDQSPEVRKQLIDTSVAYYYEMVAEIPGVIPTVHGWTLEEMERNLELITDPDKARVAMGSYAAMTRGTWTMGNLNPHEGNEVGVGSMKSFHNSFDYVPFTDNHSNKHRDKLNAVASPVPGRVDLGIDIPFIEKVKSRVATAVPGKVDAGIQDRSNTPMVAAPKKRLAIGSFVASAVGADGGAAIQPSKKKVALGSFVSSTTGPLGEKLAVGTFAATATKPVGHLIAKTEQPKVPRVSFNVIMDRIASALNFLKKDYEVFMLGGASPHMVHQIFMAGASWTDTSAWRIKGLMGEIYLWGHSSGHNSFHIGYSTSSKKVSIDTEGINILKEYLEDPTHPLNGMTVHRFLKIGYMGMKQWRKTWKKEEWEIRPGPLRMLHNAWVLKQVVEPVAKDYASAPDKYHKYLQKCLAPRPILSKRLDYLHNKLKYPYVQTDLEVYLK